MAKTSLQILIVDDNPEDRDLYKRLLLSLNGKYEYRFLEAELGEDGLAVCRAEYPDCILLDYYLPDLDGLEFLTALEGENGILSAPTIMLTGSGSETLVAEAMRAGAVDYIPKSRLSRNSLERAVANAIDKHRLQVAIEKHRLDLEQTNQELRRRNEEIQNFYHILSHELKTPLTAIREFVSIVLDGLAGPVSAEQRDYLQIAKDSCNQITLGLNDLLDATRLETGKLHISLCPVSITQVVSEAVAVMLPATQAKEIRLQQVIALALPDVWIDARRISQVLANLLSNALKFTPKGGEIEVKVSHEPQRPAWIRVSVSDTGRGIEPERCEYVFDRLYQVRSDDVAIEGGLGLGLYICQEIVRLHGGEIWVDSTPDIGSTFSFTVPTHSTDAPPTDERKGLLA